MVHEIGHMFTMSHCTFYKCKMNGSIGEGDSTHPMLCPVCLRKPHYNIGFNLLQRYKALLTTYTNYTDLRFQRLSDRYRKLISKIENEIERTPVQRNASKKKIKEIQRKKTKGRWF